MRVGEGRKGRSLLAIKKWPRSVVGEGRREKSLLCDPGSESRLERREKRRAEIDNKWGKDEKKIKKKSSGPTILSSS